PAAGEPQRLERLRRRHLVHEVQVDVEEVGLARRTMDHVRVPDLLGEGPPAHADVTAPSAAEPTSVAYFASAPVRYRGAGARQRSRRRASSGASTSRSIRPRATSIVIRSPSPTTAAR